MMMTIDDVLYSLHSTPPHSPCRCLLTTAAPQMSRWLSCAQCWLLLDRYCIGYQSQWTEISPNSNTTQYLQILPSTQLPNASIVLTLICLYPTDSINAAVTLNNASDYRANGLRLGLGLAVMLVLGLGP